jgi:hypothetical protein
MRTFHLPALAPPHGLGRQATGQATHRPTHRPTQGPIQRPGQRAVWRLLAAAAALVALTAGCAAPDGDQVPLPSFEQAEAVEAAEWGDPSEPLPDDCGRLMTTDELTALLGRPLGSLTLRTVRGVAEPSVGRIARLACRYSPAGQTGAPVLNLNVGRYDTPESAARQWKLNSDAERAGSPSRDLEIGAARAVLVERPGSTTLILTYVDSTITLVLPGPPPVPERAPQDVLVDLALRVIPRVVPPPSSPRADTGTHVEAADLSTG